MNALVHVPAEVWYRITDQWVGRDSVGLVLTTYRVLKHTPKGVFLDTEIGKRWVSDSTRKRYAYPTQQLALESFIKRKQRQIRLVSVTLRRAQAALDLAVASPVDALHRGTTLSVVEWI